MTRRGALILAVLAVSARATADWPQWRGPSRDGTAPAVATRTSWPRALRPAWKVPAGSGHAAPVEAGGRVFLFSRVGEEETVQALDLSTGRSLWRQGYPAPYRMNSAATAHGKGPKATPVVADGRVFALGIGGILSAHEAATGRLLWRKSFAGEYPETAPLYGAAQSPVVEGGRLIAHLGGPGKGALTAFDVATGAVAWSWPGDGPAYGSPVVADIGGSRQVVTFTETMLVGVDAGSGRLLWKMPFTTEYVQNAVTPLVHGDLVIFSGLDHPLKAVRVARQGGDWTIAPVWENADVALYMSSPVLAGGRVCGLSHRKKGQFFCLDSATGRSRWLSEGRQGENAALAVAGRTLIALTTEGELLVADAAAPAFQVLQRYPVADNPTWAHVALAGDGVLVKDTETLAYLRF